MGICGSTNKIESTIDVAYQTTNTVPLVQDVSANSVLIDVSANDVSGAITSLAIPIVVNADPDPK
jgi:hypothetical protein